MSRQWNGWGDRYDAYGIAAGLAVFAALGALEDYGTTAGGEAWIFSACAGAGAGYMTTAWFRIKRRDPALPPVREPLPPTPLSYVLSVVMTVAGAGILWGVAVGPIGLAGVSLVVFIATQVALAAVRRGQFRARRTAKHDGT